MTTLYFFICVAIAAGLYYGSKAVAGHYQADLKAMIKLATRIYFLGAAVAAVPMSYYVLPLLVGMQPGLVVGWVFNFLALATCAAVAFTYPLDELKRQREYE